MQSEDDPTRPWATREERNRRTVRPYKPAGYHPDDTRIMITGILHDAQLQQAFDKSWLLKFKSEDPICSSLKACHTALPKKARQVAPIAAAGNKVIPGQLSEHGDVTGDLVQLNLALTCLDALLIQLNEKMPWNTSMSYSTSCGAEFVPGGSSFITARARSVLPCVL